MLVPIQVQVRHLIPTRSIGAAKRRRIRIRDDLGDPEMIAQVNEQQMAVVALAVDPAREADGFTDIGDAQLGAAMGAIGVHLETVLVRTMMAENARRASMGESFLSTREGAAIGHEDSCVSIL